MAKLLPPLRHPLAITPLPFRARPQVFDVRFTSPEAAAAAGLATARNNIINVPLLAGGTVERAALVPAIGDGWWYGCGAFTTSTSNGLVAVSSAAEYGTAQRTIATPVSGIVGARMPAEDTGFDAVALSLYTDANNCIRLGRRTSTRVLFLDVTTNGVLVGTKEVSEINDNVELLVGFVVEEGMIKLLIDDQEYTATGSGIIPPASTNYIRVLADPSGAKHWLGAMNCLRIE